MGIVLTVVGALSPASAWAAEAPPIVSLAVRGAQKIEAATIIQRSGLTIGTPADAAILREAVKTVYRMGYFDDVSIEQESVENGVQATIVVVERPALTEVKHEGYDQIGLDKVKEQVTLTAQPFIDLKAVDAAAHKLQQYYISEGYADARVVPVTKPVAPGSVSVTFVIQEGGRTKIRTVSFEGNQAVPDGRLRKIVETKPYSWLTSWFTGSGIQKQDVLDQDVERLRDFYLNEGYVQVQVGTPRVKAPEVGQAPQIEGPGAVTPTCDMRAQGCQRFPPPSRRQGVEPTAERFEVVFPVVEGARYRVDKIQVSGNQVLSTENLTQGLALHRGDIFRRNLLRQDITYLTDRYGERGYAFVDVRPQFVPQPETRKIDLTYEVREGKPVRVREISVEGNDKTYDYVIRRELRVSERELVNTKALKRSFQRINNLNFFDSVDIVPQPLGDDQMDLKVRVKEKPTGTFSIGGGYSSNDGPVVQADVTQGNLFGRGQLLRARFERSTRRTETYTLTFREPYLFETPGSGPVSGQADLFSNEQNLNTYKTSRVGGSLSLNKSFGEFVTGGVSYTHETTNTFGVTTTPFNPTPPDPVTGVDDKPNDTIAVPSVTSPQILDAVAKGKTTTSRIGFTVSRDTRDFYFDPKEGGRQSLVLEYAGGFLRGDNRFYKVVGDTSRFVPLWWNTVFSVHLRAGFVEGIGQAEPFNERFIVGGITTIRGFEFGEAGPVSVPSGDILGGNKELIFNVEYVFPLVEEAKLKGLVFFDAGRAFDNNERITFGTVPRTCPDGSIIVANVIRYSAGFGIRMLLPIGPIRLEWGYNLDPQCNERQGLFPEFTIGTVF